MLCFLIPLTLCATTQLKLDHTQQHEFLLISGSEVVLDVVKSHTLLVFSTLGNATATVCVNDASGDCNEVGTLGFFNETYNISGVYMANYTGSVTIKTEHYVTVKFAAALLSSDCDLILTTNTRNYTAHLNYSDFQHSINFCFFASTFGTYQYKVSYKIDDSDYLHIIRNDHIPRNYGGDNRFSGTSAADDPVVFTLDTSADHINSTVNITLISENIIPDTNVTMFVPSNELYFLHGQYLDDFPEPEVDSTVSDIVSIALVVIIVASGIGCIIYRIVSYCRKKKMRELQRIERERAPKKRYKKIIRSKHTYVKQEEQSHYELKDQEDNIQQIPAENMA